MSSFESVLLNTWFIPAEGEPTDTQPGTLARVLVFCQRLERGEQLFHPADRHCFDDADNC